MNELTSFKTQNIVFDYSKYCFSADFFSSVLCSAYACSYISYSMYVMCFLCVYEMCYLCFFLSFSECQVCEFPQREKPLCHFHCSALGLVYIFHVVQALSKHFCTYFLFHSTVVRFLQYSLGMAFHSAHNLRSFIFNAAACIGRGVHSDKCEMRSETHSTNNR